MHAYLWMFVFSWVLFFVYQGESKTLKEQLRQKEEQLQATQQQANMLKAELRDSSNARDRSMADLYRIRLESESLKKGKMEARAECSRLEKQLEEMKTLTQQEAVKRCPLVWLKVLAHWVRNFRMRFSYSSSFPIKMLATDAKTQKIKPGPFFYDWQTFPRQCVNVIDNVRSYPFFNVRTFRMNICTDCTLCLPLITM